MDINLMHADPKVALIELLNLLNSTQLVASDFEFSDPVEYHSESSQANTSIRITPSIESGYYGSCDIKYTRIVFDTFFADFGQRFNTANITTQTKLSELIPIINETYGIYLRPDDIVDVDLPIVDPTLPERRRKVLLKADPTSIFFSGECELDIARRATPVPSDDGKVRRYYAYVKGKDIAHASESIACVDANGDIVPTFEFLANVTSITEFRLDRVFFTSNSKLILNGLFTLTYNGNDNGTVIVENAVNAECLVVSTDGLVISYLDDFYYDNDQTLVYQSHPKVGFKYCIDPADASTPSCVYRYRDSDGRIDSGYFPAIDYVPEMIRVDSSNRLYTVTPAYTGEDPHNPGVEVGLRRVDRMLADGTLDEFFTPVYITVNDQFYNPFKILDLCPVENDGFYLVVDPVYGVDIGSEFPVINNRPLFTITDQPNTTHAWNPIIAFFEDGRQDVDFNPLLKTSAASSVYEPTGSPLLSDSHVLCVTTESITFFTYRQNPISGFMHQQPIHFNINGEMTLLSTQAYFEQVKWTQLTNVTQQSNGDIFAVGKFQSLLSTGGYSAPESGVVVYAPTGQLKKVLLKTSAVGESISDVFLEELVP